MLDIQTGKDGAKATFALQGRVDTVTAPQLEAALAENEGVTDIVLDLEKLEYISSAGLRVLLSTQKRTKGAGGSMVLKNVNDLVMEVFDMTGFADILTIE